MPVTEKGYCKFFGAFAKVYTLADEKGNVFYVGCTILELEKRIAVHISQAKAKKSVGNHRKNQIIRSLGYKVVVTVVELKWITADKSQRACAKARLLEKEWIMKYHRMGSKLCNRDIDRHLIYAQALEKSFIGQKFTTFPKGQYQTQILEVSRENEAQDIITQPIVQ